MKTYGGFLISQIRQLSGRTFGKILKEKGIDAFNGPQGRILYVLWEQGELSITDIARLTSLANTTLTGMLDRMEAQGLVVRIPDQHNRRRILIQLTLKARQLQDAYDEVSEKNNAIFYAGFTQSEIQQFEAMLKRILQNYEEESQHE
ncbi:MarR family transcriptional regulator [Holdemania massiliensis]|uniref:MarR family transcriptional regulator n=1 Tax=Holdemania massiliensis TaxID=1468449 RepID=UPI003562AB88